MHARLRLTQPLFLLLLLAAPARSERVRLQNETIDTAPARRQFARSGNADDKLDTDLRVRRGILPDAVPLLVQFTGPLLPVQLESLRKAGAQTVGYLPDNALLVRCSPARLDAVARLSFVQWVGEYKPAHKLQAEILSLARRGAFHASTQALSRARAFGVPEAASTAAPRLRASDYPDAPDYDEPKMLTIVLFDNADRAAVAAQVEQRGGTVASSSATRSGGLLRVRLAPTAAVQLAEQPSIRWIEPYREPKLLNNVAAQGPRMNAEYAWTNFFLTGSNQIIAVCDTGLDSGNTNTIHPDFSNKVHRAIARADSTWRDWDGHGTHVSGSVLGSGQAYSNGLYKGIAYDARLVIQSVMDGLGYLSGLPEDLNELFLEAYTNDARIHSDSWGAAVDGAYTVDARQADEFLWNHQDMLILFAAGNEGADSLPTGNPDGVVDEDSLSAPGTAKNVLTVGAAESARTNGGYATRLWSVFGYHANPLSNDVISASYDGTNQGMAAFSSRGPCDDGRTKPDIVAPGTDIISCRSRGGIIGNGWGVVDGTTNYMYSGGTSMATPLTAGAAGLVRQYLIERRGIANPPGALIKAMMLNGARTLSPGQYGGGAWREIPDQARPNNVEGWGHVNLGETLQPPAGRTNALHTGLVATGQTNTYTFISTHTNTLSVVLAWHDYPGELAAAQALVNDLDLRVTTPDGQAHVGNGIVGGDRINNVEGLDIFPLTAGTTVVQVVGYNVPQGTNQPYALVIREAPETYAFKLQRATHDPLWPTNNQAVTLQTFVQAGVGGIGGVTNFHRINNGPWVEASASPASGYGPGIVYTHPLAGQPLATRVDYYAVAYDSTGNPQTSPTNTFYVADYVAYVKTNGTPVPPYNTWATAATNINEAIYAVIPGGIVWVTNGTYDGEVVIRKSCTVKSVNGPEVTLIDGRGTNRCVKMDGVIYSVLDGFTLTNGVTPNGDILGDKAGGGVLLREYAVVQNCIIRGNRGMYGGGAACYNSKFRYEAGTISNCVIEGNVANTYYGGGVRLAYGGYLTHSHIRNNRGADTAGGVYFEGLGGFMENCLIAGNVATSGLATGGGVELYGGGTMANCTVVSNTAGLRGGVNFIYISKMVNSIVWSNRQVTGFDADDENGHANINRRADYSCAAGLSNGTFDGVGNITNHPKFADAGAGNYRLTASSPCRDTGANDFWEELFNEYQYRTMEGKSDLDGTPRIKNGLVDLGAYELLFTDTNAPLAVLLHPPDNSANVDPATDLVLTFDENIHPGPGSLHLYRGDGTLSQSFAAGGAAVAIVGATATVTLTNALSHTNAYYVQVDANAFRDAATNWYAGIATTSEWNFSTRDAGTFTTNTLRVDFGTNLTAESDGAWEAFPVSYATFTTTSRVYALGSASITVTVRSASSPSGRDRNSPADSGACTYGDVYRDLVQVASGGLTAVVAGVSAGAQIDLRLWAYDYSFADAVTFSVRDVTDGRNNLLGTVLNRTGASYRPTDNTMYSVAASTTAGTNGTLVLQITGDSGPARLNGLELNVSVESIISTSTLTIASAHGMAYPAVGVHSYVDGSQVTCSITSTPILQDSTQLTCTGWTGTGSVPSSGAGTSVTFTITNTSTLTWLWTTNVESVAVSNLAVDTAFHPAVGDRIMGLDVDPQGRLMIVGSFTNIGTVHRQQIARLLDDGTLDTNLTVGAAYGDHDWALSVLCHTNGLSYVGGTMNGALGNFARYTANGSHDTSFTGTVDNAVDSLLQLADDGVLAGGQFTYAMDEEHGGLARLNATGGIVSAFTTTLDNFDGGWGSVYALAQQADGRLVIGGDFKTINSTSRLNIGRVHLDGTLDTTFTNQLTGTSARVNCLLVQTNGLLAGGFFSHVNGQRVTNLVRFTSADAVDAAFAVYPNGRVNALLALPDGRTLMGGDFTTVNGDPHPGLAMLKNDHTLDDSFTMGVTGGFGAAVHALHLDHDNGVLVAGEFGYLGDVPRANLGRLLLGPSTNTPPSTNTTGTAEYWAGMNQDGHARNASRVSLSGAPRVRWARALTNLNESPLAARTNYAGQRGNTIAIRDGRVLALVPAPTNALSYASGHRFASFGTFALGDGQPLHETITTHVGGGTRGPAILQDSDTAYGLVNFYWNSNDVVFTAYGSDAARAYAFDAFSGTLPPFTPFSPMAEAPNASGYFAMTDDNPLLYAHGGLNTHQSLSKPRAGVVGAGEQQIVAMKCYNAYLVGGWDVFGFTMTNTLDNGCAPEALGTLITAYRFTNQPYGASTRWVGVYPSNTFAGFGLNHVRGAPRPIALGADGRIYYYGFRNTMSGAVPTAPDYAAGMRLFAVSATNGAPLFEIGTGWNPEADAPLASPAWGEQRYHFFLPQIAVTSNRVVVFHPQVNQGHTTNLWTRGRLFCFDTAATSLAWSVAYTVNTFQAKLRMDEVVVNDANNTSPNCMWADNTEQAVQMTVAGGHAYVVDPGIVGGAASGALQLTVHRYALNDGSASVTNLVPRDGSSNTIAAVAERMVNLNDNTNRVALRELAAADGALVALVDVDLLAQALVVIDGDLAGNLERSPAAAIHAPFAGIPPALQTFNDHRLRNTATTNVVPNLGRAGRPLLQVYDTGSPIPFDASGSVDPDGGTLNYAWEFGDGATGTAAQTTHTYSSWGGAPAITTLQVRLTVVDDEGHTDRVSRTIWVRDVGASSTTTLTATADGYVYTGGSNSNANFGTAQDLEIRRTDADGITQEVAYLKFDLSGIPLANVADAVLRVFVMTPRDYTLEAHAVTGDWTESGLRGTNAPALGDRLGDVLVGQYDENGSYTRAFHQWVEFPVLGHVLDSSQGTERAFALVTTNVASSVVELASRQSTNTPSRAPQLVLRWQGTGHAAPLVTSAPPAIIVYTNTTTQTLSVAAASAGGASNLTYSWRQVRGPSRAAISTNHSGAAGATAVALPPGGGTYVFRCIVDDGLLYNEAEVTFQETEPAVPARKLFVILLGGQSNARGYGYQQYLVDTTNALANPQTDVDFYFSPTAYLTQYVLTNLMSGSGFPDVKGVAGVNQQYPPQSAPVNRFGPELSLGRTVRDRIPVASSRVAVIKFAQSGTDLYNDWKPDGTTNKTADGTVYQAFHTTVRQGLTALTNAYPDYQLEILGMGWVQGEADGVDAAGTNYLSYQSNLTTFITDIRATYGSNIIFALSKLSSNQYPIAHLTEIRAAQEAVAATVTNTFATETLGTNYLVATAYAEGSLHYLSAALLQIGKDLGNAIMDGSTMGGGTNEPPLTTTNTLTVASAYGQAVPQVGSHPYTNGAVVACSITNTPLLQQATTQVFASGWTLSGNSPTSGSTTNFNLTLTNSATLTWLWQTNVMLQAGAGAGGTISSTGGWYALGGSVTVTAMANSGYAFAGWIGEVSGSTNANPLTLTMDRARSVTANFATNEASGGNGLVWRVDFNGSGNDTLASSNFTGWTVSASSRTQSFANVDGGPVSSFITVRLLGSGTFTAFQRNMNAGSATNLFRDGGQTTASGMTLGISNLSPGAVYTLRVWYFDDEFSMGTTQTYANVTDGASASLGALTNTFAANAAAGHASLPGDLYDARYCLTAELSAGTNGNLDIAITPNAGNTKINAMELSGIGAEPPVSYSLSATANDASWGSVSPAGGMYMSGTVVQVTAMASNGFSFISWSGDASGTSNPLHLTMDADKNITATFATNTPPPAATSLLVVASAHGTPVPAGTNHYTNGTIVNASVAGSPIVNGSTTITCTGWTLAGNDPGAGTGTSFSMTITNNATLTWLWTTNIAAGPVTNGYVVIWSSIPDARYAIEVGTNLHGAFTAVASNIAATPAMNIHTAAPPDGSPSLFIYRVRKE